MKKRLNYLLRFLLLISFLYLFMDKNRDESAEVFAANGSSTFPYVINDFTFYETPDTERPEKGVPFTDPYFHTTITRITDTPQDIPDAKPIENRCKPGYPKHNIENADGTMLIIQASKYPGWYIFDANTYEYIKTIPASYVDTKDPDVRWDNIYPNIFYTTYKTKFYQCDASLNPISCEELHDFQNDFPDVSIARVYTKEEGDASDDRRYWAFFLKVSNEDRDLALIVYDKDYYGINNGKIISMIKEDSVDSDGNPLWFFGGGGFVSMSPSGNYVWVGDTHRIYPRDLSKVWFLGDRDYDSRYWCCHADMAYDDEVLSFKL